MVVVATFSFLRKKLSARLKKKPQTKFLKSCMKAVNVYDFFTKKKKNVCFIKTDHVNSKTTF